MYNTFEVGVIALAVLILQLAIHSSAPDAQAAARPAPKPPPPAPTGRLCRVKLLSDVEPDMTSIDTVVANIVKPDMTDEEKVIALFWFVHDHRFWYPAFYPVENGRPVYDPVLLVNCYPALICQQDAGLTSAFWAAAGFDVRYWQLVGHTTGEVFYGGKWRNLDATFGRYRRAPDGGLADVKIAQGMYKPGKSRIEPFDDFEIGHQMHLSLRKGESFTRHWSPLKNERGYWRPSNTASRRPDDRPGHRRGMGATMARKPYRFDTKGAGLANGEWLFQANFSQRNWKDLFEKVDGLIVESAGGTLRPRSGKAPGELIWRVYSPYTITGGWLEGEFEVGDGGEIIAFASTDHGATWTKIGEIQTGQQKLALRKFIAGKFEYLLKLTIRGAAPNQTGVRSLATTTIVQVNPLSLPALKPGRTAIRVAAGEQLETLTIWPNLETGGYRTEVLQETNVGSSRRYAARKWGKGLAAVEAGKPSTIVYKVQAPGPIRRIRWGGKFRSEKGDVSEMFYSLDGRKWKKQNWLPRWTLQHSTTPNDITPVSETIDGLPEGTSAVFLKYRFVRPGRERWLLSALRIDADYVPTGTIGALPLEVTYCWEEENDGKLVEKTHTEVIETLPYTYSINVKGNEKPLMKWVRMRLYDGPDEAPEEAPQR